MRSEAELLEIAKEMNLRGVQVCEGHTQEEIDEAYNGIGAEWMGGDLRDKVTDFLSVFEPAAFVHDCEYAFARPHGPNEFQTANWNFLLNCLKLAGQESKFFSWDRWKMYLVAWAMYRAVSVGGWKAWNEAEKNGKQE